jgi:hypothetical protein
MNIPPIFIIGVGRSGTTLIRQMINSHSKVAVPYESHFITKYMNKISEYGDLEQDKNLMQLLQDICNEPILENWDYCCTAKELFEEINQRDLATIFDSFFQLYAKHHGKIMWGDKSDYLNRMYQIRELYPDAKFIHIIRDGRDVANSVMKMKWGPKNIIEAADWWQEHVRLGYSMGRMLGDNNYMEVRYEDLVTTTEESLRKICKFINVDFETSMLEYYKSSVKFIPQNLLSQHYNADTPPSNSRTYAWKTEMSLIDSIIFQQMAGDVLKEFKYELVNKPVSALKLKLHKIRILMKL